jgi:hypothetical protein
VISASTRPATRRNVPDCRHHSENFVPREEDREQYVCFVSQLHVHELCCAARMRETRNAYSIELLRP